MSLTDKERAILACIQHRADESIPKIARITKLTEHTIRYSLRKLIDEKVIAKRAYIDIYRLGFSKHAFFFSLSITKEAARRQVISYLQKHPRIAYLAEIGGDYRFKVDICTRNQSELREFLLSFSERFGDILRDKAFVQLLEQTEVGVKCVSSRAFEVLPLRMGVSDRVEEVDELDHRILAILSEISERSFADLAREVGISLSTFLYRIEQLKRKKILIGFRYVVNGKLVGLGDYFHLLYVKGMRDETRQRLFAFCESHPNIRYFVPCIGSWDFEIGSNVENAERAVEIADQLYEAGGESVSRIQTLPLFRFSKVSNYPLSKD